MAVLLLARVCFAIPSDTSLRPPLPASLQPDRHPALLSGAGAYANETAERTAYFDRLPWSMPCSPGGADLAAEPIRLFAQRGRKPTFFLWDTDELDLSETIECFGRQQGMDTAKSEVTADEYDAHLPPNVAEHIVDLHLLMQLRAHPQRTDVADEADFHFIGATTEISYLTTIVNRSLFPNSPTCGGVEGHLARMERVAAALAALPHFQRRNGSDFVLINSHFAPMRDVLGTPLYALLRPSAVLATVDRAFGKYKNGINNTEWTGAWNHWTRSIVIPYRATGASDALVDSLTSQRPLASDRYRVFFAGNFERTHDGAQRNVMLRMVDALPPDEVSVTHARFDLLADLPSNGSLAPAGGRPAAPSYLPYERMVRATAEALLNSTFCFVPAGDSATSRRLFDALAFGCVPIVLVAYDEIAHTLPFRASVDWPSVAIFAGSLACTQQRIDETRAWLASLVDGLRAGSPVVCEAVAAMRAAGRAAFDKHLSLIRPGAVDALLTEMRADPRVTRPFDSGLWATHGAYVPDGMLPPDALGSALPRSSDAPPADSPADPRRAVSPPAGVSKASDAKLPLDFIHIPKNAGSTIEEIGFRYGHEWGMYKFERHARPFDAASLAREPWRIFRETLPRIKLPCNRYHVPPAAFAHYGDFPYAGRETFCIVRHPFSKVVSQIQYWSDEHGGGDSEHEPADPRACDGCCSAAEINARVRAAHRLLNGTLRGAKWGGRLLRRGGGADADAEPLGSSTYQDCHWVPQVQYAYGPSFVPPSADSPPAPLCDHVLRIEHLAADWAKLMSGRANLIPAAALADGATNMARCGATKVGVLDATSRQMIHEMYQDDFRAFGYSAQLSAGAGAPGQPSPTPSEAEAGPSDTRADDPSLPRQEVAPPGAEKEQTPQNEPAEWWGSVEQVEVREDDVVLP